MKYLLILPILLLAGCSKITITKEPIEKSTNKPKLEFVAKGFCSLYPKTEYINPNPNYTFFCVEPNQEVADKKTLDRQKAYDKSNLAKFEEKCFLNRERCDEQCYNDYRTTFVDCQTRCESRWNDCQEEFREKYWKLMKSLSN